MVCDSIYVIAESKDEARDLLSVVPAVEKRLRFLSPANPDIFTFLLGAEGAFLIQRGIRLDEEIIERIVWRAWRWAQHSLAERQFEHRRLHNGWRPASIFPVAAIPRLGVDDTLPVFCVTQMLDELRWEAACRGYRLRAGCGPQGQKRDTRSKPGTGRAPATACPRPRPGVRGTDTRMRGGQA